MRSAVASCSMSLVAENVSRSKQTIKSFIKALDGAWSKRLERVRDFACMRKVYELSSQSLNEAMETSARASDDSLATLNSASWISSRHTTQPKDSVQRMIAPEEATSSEEPHAGTEQNFQCKI